jgi:hypothetical protein
MKKNMKIKLDNNPLDILKETPSQRLLRVKSGNLSTKVVPDKRKISRNQQKQEDRRNYDHCS